MAQWCGVGAVTTQREKHMSLDLFYVWLTTTCIALSLGFAWGFDVGINKSYPRKLF